MFDNKDRFRNGRILRTAISLKTEYIAIFSILKLTH